MKVREEKEEWEGKNGLEEGDEMVKGKKMEGTRRNREWDLIVVLGFG